MPRLSNAIASGVLLAALALSGCGGGDPSSSATLRPGEIAFRSPATVENQKIPVRYTCDGKDISPPLEWGVIPSATKELVIFLFGLKLINPGAGKGQVQAKLTVQWVVAGLNPTLQELPAGELPPGALLGRNPSGQRSYSVCPAKGQSEDYLFRIYALSHKLSLRRGFSAEGLLKQPDLTTLGRGEFLAKYTRV